MSERPQSRSRAGGRPAMHGARPVWAPPLPTAIAFVVYATVAASFSPYTWPMRVATAVACATAAALAVRRGWLRRWNDPPRAAAHPRGVVGYTVWLVLLTALLAFLLVMYFSAPRQVYPTFSSLAANAFAAGPPVRTAAFMLWLWIGWYLVAR